MKLNTVLNEDCLLGMSRIADKSVDMILCDLPYGTTACKWDVVIPFKPLWEHYERIIKDNGAIVLTATHQFSNEVINSNRKGYKYKWYWNKKLAGNFASAKFQPLNVIEEVLIFGKSKTKYYPIKTKGILRHKGTGGKTCEINTIHRVSSYNDEYYPSNIIEVPNTDRINSIHPTQKPVALFEYLIKTYTNEGETVLDNAMGSGTTAIACINTNRNYLGFEKEEKYYKLIQERIKSHTPQLKLIA